jgi:membrane-associated PAP2 superfamily phosphatase
MTRGPYDRSGFAGAPLALTLAGAAVALAWDASGWDLALAGLAGNRAGFPWRDHWLLAGVLHEGARRAGWVLVTLLCLGIWWPAGPLRRLRRVARVELVIGILAAALAVSLLKAGSSTSCPWDLVEFGGLARHASHWTPVADGGPGRCFPAGHASTGFSFFGGYFAFRDGDRALAHAWLLGAAACGLLLGLAQQWRGAHFMSHTLWTGFVCWCVAAAVHFGFRLRPGAAPHA